MRTRNFSERRILWEYVATILGAAAVAFLVRFFVWEAYRIPSAAMKPALVPGDFIFVSKWPYAPWNRDGRAPARGEVVVFSSTEDRGADYLKRVIGIPGDTVEVRDGVAILNGKPLAESAPGSSNNNSCWQERLPARSYTACRANPALEPFSATRVPSGSVFVLGDLRSKGRAIGLIPIESIKGNARSIWLSLDRSGGIRLRWERMFRRVE